MTRHPIADALVLAAALAAAFLAMSVLSEPAKADGLDLSCRTCYMGPGPQIGSGPAGGSASGGTASYGDAGGWSGAPGWSVGGNGQDPYHWQAYKGRTRNFNSPPNIVHYPVHTPQQVYGFSHRNAEPPTNTALMGKSTLDTTGGAGGGGGWARQPLYSNFDYYSQYGGALR